MWRKQGNILAYINQRTAETYRPVERPLMRYFGGKWKNATWILSHFPPHHIYVEPYGGAASVMARKEPIFREVYNDINGDVVNLFRVLQDRRQYAELVHRLKFTPFARAEYDLPLDEHGIDPVERARRLLIKSWFSFGAAGDDRYKTGFRTNISQTDKDPAREWRNWLDVLPMFVERFRRVTIENAPATTVITGHDSPDTLFYVDPPYMHSTRRRNRYQYEMTNKQHEELLQVLLSVKGMVVLSGYDNSLYNDALNGWRRVTKMSQANGNAKRIEVLWLSPPVTETLDEQRQMSGYQLQLAM
jgi:DNA adenine methylase